MDRARFLSVREITQTRTAQSWSAGSVVGSGESSKTAASQPSDGVGTFTLLGRSNTFTSALLAPPGSQERRAGEKPNVRDRLKAAGAEAPAVRLRKCLPVVLQLGAAAAESLVRFG
jgi:hypothetical protein